MPCAGDCGVVARDSSRSLRRLAASAWRIQSEACSSCVHRQFILASLSPEYRGEGSKFLSALVQRIRALDEHHEFGVRFELAELARELLHRVDMMHRR